MNQILALREKRAKAWEAAKAFLESKRGTDGLLSAEDTATYDRMEWCGIKKVDSLFSRIS